MLEPNRSLLNRWYILINVRKALASIVSMCSLHVIFLSNITPRYFKEILGSGYFFDRRLVGQSVLVSGPHVVPMTRFLILSAICGLLDVGAPSLTRGRICNLLIQFPSLSGPSPAELMTTSYSLIWDSPTMRAGFLYLYPPGRGWPSYIPGHLPLTSLRGTVEVF
jgi:hypothetical protein